MGMKKMFQVLGLVLKVCALILSFGIQESHGIPLVREESLNHLYNAHQSKECIQLKCSEPLTYGPPETPCLCVLPIQIALRLTIALYTFFPLVSELAKEISTALSMKQSLVRIMGANEAGDNPDATIVLIDLVPPRRKFDHTIAYSTFRRIWHKKVVIKLSDYDVLYVRYPGLPPSPSLPPSGVRVRGSKPYPGNDNGRTRQPFGVDVGRSRKHGDGFSRIIILLIILSGFLVIVLLCATLWVISSKTREESGVSSPSLSLASSVIFSSSDIEKATDNFNEKRILGEGGFGRVYSGVLEDGTKVAMKILKKHDEQGDQEFMAEVEMLSRLHHRNLVKLIGICAEEHMHCLVYELIPNGSLESHLHGKETDSLSWRSRLKIALGSAQALAYLHEDSNPSVIHRDFKASNILLEDDFTPKVSDFGLACAALDEGMIKQVPTRVMGTFGYVAPEYAMTGHLLVKSDVYSYGVVLLELLTGRKPVDMSQPPGEENVVSWARPMLTSREGLESIVDASLGAELDYDSVGKVAAIALMCVESDVSCRPFMSEVAQALKLVCSECDDSKEEYSVFSYDYELDVCDESFRREFRSGPLLGTGKDERMWSIVKRLSGGSVSEHGGTRSRCSSSVTEYGAQFRL